VLERLPVIAWRIDEYQTGERLSDSNPIAISLNSTSFENDTAVRCPSGRVTIYENGRVFENEEKWIEWIREKRTEKKEAAE